MVEFPIAGIFREPLLVLEITIFILCFEFGLLFLYRFIKEDKNNKMILAWSVFFFSYAVMNGILIFGEFFAIPGTRVMYLNIGYFLLGIGALFFTFNVERELKRNKHILSLFLLTLLLLTVINLFFLIIDLLVIIYFLYAIPFIVILLIYILKFLSKIKEYRLNIYGFFFGFLIFGFGYSVANDILMNLYGLIFRVGGAILIIVGICLISLLFINLPTLKEFEWTEKLIKLFIMHKSGSRIYDHDFIKLADEPSAKHISTDLMAEGLVGIGQMITELIQSKEKVKIMDHQDKKIIFSYSDNLIITLIVDEYLKIYRNKLEKLINSLEIVYTGILQDWTGDIAYKKPIQKLISKIFS
ncbi:MAG: hypothetical protein ACFFD2_10070 [Promethearchaeota archaeon]